MKRWYGKKLGFVCAGMILCGCVGRAEVTDYAKVAEAEAWLRHPVLGDPSFDTFEKLGGTVHQSEPPYEWAVNGSLFRDPADGAWYLFGGLYPQGYATKKESPSHFAIYRSRDAGTSWENLGRGFERGFCFDGYDSPVDNHPDVVMIYDPSTKLYWLAYDWSTADWTWAKAHHPPERKYDGGAALASAESPAGPFTHLPKPLHSNYENSRNLGRFSRAYATTVLKRKGDWAAFILCDSGPRFSWGLACLTAPSPEGPWSKPVIVLSVDRPEYYPAPVEFHPCFVVGEAVYAPATSVALNRNYQTIHKAALEEAHKPEAWTLAADGNVWHSRPDNDEKYGIWGQTFHGFVHDGTFTVMYPSRDKRGFGTLSVAQRPWDKPHSDGFTFSGHAGKSLSPLLRAYKDFTLDAEFTLTGTIELAFDYAGMLGPHNPTSNGTPSKETLSNYKALRISGGAFALVAVGADATEQVLDKGTFTANADGTIRASLRVDGENVTCEVNGARGNASGVAVTGGPLALVAHTFSVFTCSRFSVTGEVLPCTLRYQANDAIIGAGQSLSAWPEARGFTCQSPIARIGSGNVFAKWNVICDTFTLFAPKSPKLGKMKVIVDGEHKATVDLSAAEDVPSAPVYVCTVGMGRHGIAVRPEEGSIVVDVLEVRIGVR